MYNPDRKPLAAQVFPCLAESLEPRQLLSAALSVSSSLMVFNAVNGDASQVETLTLTNSGDAPLSLTGVSIVADPTQSANSSAQFAVTNSSSLPSTLAAGGTFGLMVDYTAGVVGLQDAVLDIASSDAASPTTAVDLHGIGTVGLYGGNQPSLERILHAYDEPNYDDVGETNEASAYYPEPPAANDDEVDLQQMVKAGPGDVTLSVLASFVAAATEPYVLGWYQTDNVAGTMQQLFYTPTNQSQSVYVQPQGATSFDPGTDVFGFYDPSQTVKVNGSLVTGYTQDGLNTYDTTDMRKFRFFPLENADGTAVANSYIMTSTEYYEPAGYDFTNLVAIITNVKEAAPVATADTAAAESGAPASLNVLANDTATTGALVPASVTVTTAPTSGGTATVDATTGDITYTAPAGFTGADTFAYTVANSAGYTSAPATVTVTVTAAPVAADATADTTVGTAVAVPVLPAVTSPVALNPATVAVTAPLHGTASADAAGTVTYTPAAGFVGTDTFTYTVTDDNGHTSNAATVAVAVGVDVGTASGDDRSLSFTQGIGTAATVTLNRGTAEVLFAGTGTLAVSKAGRATVTGTALAISGVALSATTAASTLTTTAAALGGVTDADPLGAVVAAKAILTGTVTLASLNTLRVAAVSHATIGINSALGSATVGTVTDSAFTAAGTVKALRATAWTGDGAAPSALTAASIGTFAVTGDLTGTTVTTTGNVTALSAAALTGDTVLVGATAGTTLTTATSATIGTATLAALRLTGRTGNTFASTTVIAHTVGTASLGRVDTDNGGTADGLALAAARSVTATAAGSAVRVTRTTTANQVFGDFRIDLIDA